MPRSEIALTTVSSAWTGLPFAASARMLAARVGVSLPICDEVRAVLFDAKPVREALASLLAREPRPEEEHAARA